MEVLQKRIWWSDHRSSIYKMDLNILNNCYRICQVGNHSSMNKLWDQSNKFNNNSRIAFQPISIVLLKESFLVEINTNNFKDWATWLIWIKISSWYWRLKINSNRCWLVKDQLLQELLNKAGKTSKTMPWTRTNNSRLLRDKEKVRLTH